VLLPFRGASFILPPLLPPHYLAFSVTFPSSPIDQFLVFNPASTQLAFATAHPTPSSTCLAQTLLKRSASTSSSHTTASLRTTSNGPRRCARRSLSSSRTSALDRLLSTCGLVSHLELPNLSCTPMRHRRNAQILIIELPPTNLSAMHHGELTYN
jgi:hypothetical protein